MEENERDYKQEYESLLKEYQQLLHDYQLVALRAQMFEEWALLYKKDIEELKRFINQNEN